MTPEQEHTLDELMDCSTRLIDMLEIAKKRKDPDPAQVKALAIRAAAAETAVLQHEIECGITGQSLAITAYSAGSILVDAQQYAQALIMLYSARLMVETPGLKAELTQYATRVRQMAAEQAVETGQSRVAIQMTQEAGRQLLDSIRSGDPKVAELVETLGFGEDCPILFFIEGEPEPIDLKAALEGKPL
jgi:hypothetical protein